MKIDVEQIVEKYSNMIMQIAYQNCYNKSEAEDITQEIFVKLLKNVEKIDSEEHLKAWLIRATVNLSKDYNKSFWNRNTIKLDEELKYFDVEVQEVFKEISKLKPTYRNIIYLYYYQGYKINDIAQILNMSPNTVSSNLTRARKKLGAILLDGGEAYA